jgi:hypothetical protein
LSIALLLLAAIQFLTTAAGRHWVEDFLRPLGFAAILAGVAGPVLFLAGAALAGVIALVAIWRREPYGLAQSALAILLSLLLHVANGHPERWRSYPARLLVAAVVAFLVSAAFRTVLRRTGGGSVEGAQQ